MANTNILKTVGGLILLVVFFAAMAVYQQIKPVALDKKALKNEGVYIFDTPRAVPSLVLEDQDGNAFDTAQFKGKWSIVNFGYVFCPDVCPTNMADLRRTKEIFVENQAQELPNFYMVTVDPERDTTDVLKPYISHFDPEFVALRSSVENTAKLAQHLNVIFAKAPTKDGDMYFVDHSDNMVVLNPQGQYAAFIRPPHQPQTLYKVLNGLISQ